MNQNTPPTLMRVTPDMAREWLGVEVHNRDLSQMKITEYTYEMQKGAWQVTHQGILLGKKNAVIDGRHRLTSIINSGKSTPIWVWKNQKLNSALDLEIDRGLGRRVSFVLGITPDLGAAASFIIRSISKPKTDGMIRYVCESIKPYYDQLTRSTRVGVTNAPVRSAAFLAMFQGAQNVVEFYDIMAHGQLSAGTPALDSLNRALTSPRGRNAVPGQSEVFCLAHKAFTCPEINKLYFKDFPSYLNDLKSDMHKMCKLKEN